MRWTWAAGIGVGFMDQDFAGQIEGLKPAFHLTGGRVTDGKIVADARSSARFSSFVEGQVRGSFFVMKLGFRAACTQESLELGAFSPMAGSPWVPIS